MKQLKSFIFGITCLSLSLVLSPVFATELVFFGGIIESVVNEPVTVSWDDQNADGYELKIIHFFYEGLESEMVETTETSYTFTEMPKSSRHFEIQVRSYNGSGADRVYSVWSSSIDAACSVVGSSASGWLLHTIPAAPSW